MQKLIQSGLFVILCVSVTFFVIERKSNQGSGMAISHADENVVEISEKPADNTSEITLVSTGDKDVADIDKEATHTQSRTISIQQGSEDAMSVNAFCLNAKGEILAAVGAGPGEIRVLDDQGKLLHSWKTPVKPEAINSAADGTILAGGEGKLFHYSAEGTLLKEVAAPHAEALRENTEAMRQDAIEYLERVKNQRQSQTSTTSLKARIRSYEQMIATIEKKAETEELSKQEETILAMLPKSIKAINEQIAEAEGEDVEQEQDEKQEAGPSETEITAQIERMMKSKVRVASISTDGEAVFVATPSIKGYGFAIWKLNESWTEGTEIVTDLRGCCGQMDVQACKNGLFVAENSRKRVVCYDSEGEEVRQWGKADRTGVDGFTSCCNPMNVCFNKNGDVFTAESNTGRIKRFSAEGEFLDFVGDVKLVPGCKNVSIAVTPDHSRVYMLDLTRNHVVVMDKKPQESVGQDSLTAVTGSDE